MELSDFAPSTADPCFEEWRAAPTRMTEQFHLGDSLLVEPDASAHGSIYVSAIEPPHERPFYRIAPVGMGASRWLTIGRDLDVASVRTLAEVIPALDAAAPRSASLFAVLRLVLPRGRHVDASSAQLELGPERSTESFAIDLDDVPRQALDEADSAKLVFFIEARDVEIDFYGLTLHGVVRPDPPYARAEREDFGGGGA